jgi:FKBP-type peptidyl-prolyl cis-trans isomerase FklB
MDKLSYALGMEIARNLQQTGIDTLVYQDFMDGLVDSYLNNEMKMTEEEGEKLIADYFAKKQKEEDAREQMKAAVAKKESEEFLRLNKVKEGVTVTDSGLQYRVVQDGDGKNPTVHSRVKCHYEGKFISGEIFDSSYKRGEPVVFGLDQVIPGWSEGVCLMKPGAKYEFVIPAKLAYGERGIPGRIPGNSVLTFTVELLDIL